MCEQLFLFTGYLPLNSKVVSLIKTFINNMILFSSNNILPKNYGNNQRFVPAILKKNYEKRVANI